MDTRALLASPLGFLIGLSMGALGGGGSILSVPVLVYVAGQDPKAATSTSLVLVAITSVIGMVPHLRAGRVRVAAGVVFGVAGSAANYAGSQLNKSVDQNVLLLLFSGVMLAAAGATWRRVQRDRRRPVIVEPGGVAAAVVQGPQLRVDVPTVIRVLVLGSAVGLLTGFFGVGGGFVIVPALVVAMGFPMAEAVGTSLLVIAINTAFALAVRARSGAVLEWDVILPFLAASIAGVLTGARVAGRYRSDVLAKWFVALLVTVATYTAIRSVLAIW
ncbi:MAG TPA: sulfite exporter TauE/SafE family protein [Acidimicrobiales bacterium]